MTIYEKNVECIHRMREYMYSFIDKLPLKAEKNKTDNISAMNTLDGNRTILVEVGGKSYRLNSSYNPVNEATKWAERFNLKNLEIVITMFGFGNGIIPRELLKRMNNGEILIIFEPSKEIFIHTMENYDLTDIIEDPRVYISVEEFNESEFPRALWKFVYWTNVYSQIHCVHPLYNEMFPEAFEEYYKVIADSNDRTIINRNTESAIGKKETINAIQNLKYLKDSITTDDLKGVFSKNVPAIIVSAGPSLDKNVQELKNAKGKAVIIAVDTAVKHLLARDIIPDFTFTLDPNKWTGHYADDRSSQIPMICRIETNTEIFDKHSGRKIYFQAHKFFNKIYELFGKELSELLTGGSVSTAAFAACASMGFDKIILVGQDLAYADGGTTHAGKTISYTNSQQEIKYIEDIYGNQIQSRNDWYLFLDWFVDTIAHWKGLAIDATEGGAKIKGTAIMTLKEAIDKYCIEEIKVNEVIESVPPTFDNKQLNEIQRFVNKNIEDLELIKKEAVSAINNCDRLIMEYKKIDGESYTSKSCNKELTKINNKIEQCPVNELIDTFIADVAIVELEDIYKMGDDERENKMQTYKQAKALYKAISGAADELKPMLEKLSLL